MASIVLSTIGTVVGGAVGGPVGAALGASLGRYAGGMADNALFGSSALPGIEGPRLTDLAVQTSTYGRMIPLVYGTVRLAGNVIWSRPIRETATTTTSTAGGGGSGGRVTQTATTYSYSVSIAVAICEGPIDAVLRVWADAKQLDLSLGTYRIHKGDEEQLPDAFIESFEGIGTTPAYRGLAYIVVEDFPLAEYGNRIPNFTFEVKKKAQKHYAEEETLEEMVRSVILIPGSGEFVYDTKIQHKLFGEDVAGNWAQQGSRIPINMHNPDGVANALLALEQMGEALPNLEWVGMVVTWFGTSLDAGQCEIVPGVEYQQGATTNPDVWAVAGYDRGTARQITLVDGSPRYGGTPDDASVIRLVDAIRAKGWKVMFYPMFFMDVEDKPWRGRVTGTAENVESFFTKADGYNAFITHYNPNGQPTAWVPQAKKIWFTEYGFPSVDGATNQPNVFYDPTSSESFFPRFSRGRVDFRAQRQGLLATETQWKDSEMIERMFIWTWDARPFPYWPDLLGVWDDGPQWKTGHWVNGKLGISSLAAIVADLCRRSAMAEVDFDVSRLTDLVEGYTVASPAPARALIEQLMRGYFFDAVESDGLLKFVPRGGGVANSIGKEKLVPVEENGETRQLLAVRRAQEVELPQRVHVLYINRTSNYLQGNQSAQRQVTLSRQAHTLSLPIVFSDQSAKVLAEQWLYHSWVSRTQYECYLNMEYAALEPTDIVDVTVDGVTRRMRVTEAMQSRPGVLRLRGVAEDSISYDVYLPPAAVQSRSQAAVPPGSTRMEMLDLPVLPLDDAAQLVLRIALAGTDTQWRGAVVYRSDDGGGSYSQIAVADAPATIGTAVTALGMGPYAVLDEASHVDVLLLGEQMLESVPLPAMLNGANLAVLGAEMLQFRDAELLADGRYRLSGLLRGRLGTEYAISGHVAGERFIFFERKYSYGAAIAGWNWPVALI